MFERIILSAKKRFLFPAIVIVAFSAWLSLCHAYYKSYWHGTISRVQTVDFNMLHHTLPITLSQLILSGRTDEVQRVLDSTYGIFGLVVTDASGSQILYKTEAFYKKKTWQPNVSIDYLKGQTEPYDLLTDPPPAVVQFKHSGPRDAEAIAAGPAPTGRIIGRLYYLRGVPPEFATDVLTAISTNWFEMSGSKRGYILLTFDVLAFTSAILLLILWRRQAVQSKERELSLVERELNVRRRALDQLNMDLMSQRQRKEWLENEAELAYSRALRLKESLEKLKEAFFMLDPSTMPAGAAQISPPGGKGPISVRPPLHPPSAVIQEVESLLPDLTNNAKILRSQAEVLQTYCMQLEKRQAEMLKILEQRPALAKLPENAPVAAHVKAQMGSEQTA